MSRYPKEFKLEAIRLINEKEKPIAEIARELGVKRVLLYRWRDELEAKSDEAFTGKTGPKSDKRNELDRLRQENKELKGVPVTHDVTRIENQINPFPQG